MLRHASLVPVFAASVDSRLLKELVALAKAGHSPAEITRRIGDSAQARGLPRPSYARIRDLVIEHRPVKRNEPTWGEVITDVWVGHRSPELLVDKHLGLLAEDPRE